MPVLEDLWKVIRESRRKRSDAYAVQIEVIRSRAPKLWRVAKEEAVKQYAESDDPKLVKLATIPAEVEALAYQYVIKLRAPNWPAWLLGPLLPYVEDAKAA
jgi:hypothetical protein